MKTPTAARSAISGFTLLELMLSLAIASIILGMAVPGYRHHVLQICQEGVQLELEELATEQQAYRTIYFRFAQTLDELGLAGISRNGGYELSIVESAGTDQEFIAEASPRNSTGCARNDHTHYRINHQGSRMKKEASEQWHSGW